MSARTRSIRWLTVAVMALVSAGCAAADPVGRWQFTPEHVREKGAANLAGNAAVADAGKTKALRFDGSTSAVTVAGKTFASRTSKSQMTVEAWVRIDEFRRWSRFAGVFARQGNRRRGWFIGTHYHRFVFALETDGGKGGVTDLHSAGSAHLGHWYHVAATYDGAHMRLYVNGLLVGESAARTGGIRIPPNTPFSMGDYHNGSEFYPLKGALHEVRVYDTPLTQTQIQKHYAAKSKRLAAAPRSSCPAASAATWCSSGTRRSPSGGA